MDSILSILKVTRNEKKNKNSFKDTTCTANAIISVEKSGEEHVCKTKTLEQAYI